MIIISFLEFFLDLREKKALCFPFVLGLQLFYCLGWVFVVYPKSLISRGGREDVKKRSDEGRGRTEQGFLGFRWGVYFTAAVPGTKGSMWRRWGGSDM